MFAFYSFPHAIHCMVQSDLAWLHAVSGTSSPWFRHFTRQINASSKTCIMVPWYARFNWSRILLPLWCHMPADVHLKLRFLTCVHNFERRVATFNIKSWQFHSGSYAPNENTVAFTERQQTLILGNNNCAMNLCFSNCCKRQMSWWQRKSEQEHKRHSFIPHVYGPLSVRNLPSSTRLIPHITIPLLIINVPPQVSNSSLTYVTQCLNHHRPSAVGRLCFCNNHQPWRYQQSREAERPSQRFCQLFCTAPAFGVLVECILWYIWGVSSWQLSTWIPQNQHPSALAIARHEQSCLQKRTAKLQSVCFLDTRRIARLTSQEICKFLTSK